MNTPNKNQTSALLGRSTLIIIAVLCLVPTLVSFVLKLSGITSVGSAELFPHSAYGFYYTLIQQAAFGLAFVVGVLCFMQFTSTGSLSTPILGSALIAGGFMDVIHVLVAEEQIPTAAIAEATPFTWTMARLLMLVFLGLFLIFFLISENIRGSKKRDAALMITSVITVILCLVGGAIQIAGARNPEFLQQVYTLPLVFNILNWLPLVLAVLIGGYVIPTHMLWSKTVFDQMLMVACLPLALAQLHFAIDPYTVTGVHQLTANVLKLMAYAIPALGLIIDYRWTYEQTVKANRQLKQEVFKQAQTKETGTQYYRHLETLMSQITDPICILDSSLRIIRLNEMQSRISTNPETDTVTGKSPDDIFPPDLASIITKGASEAMETLHSISVSEEWVLSNDPEQTRYRWSFNPILDDKKRPLGVMAIGREVSSRETVSA